MKRYKFVSPYDETDKGDDWGMVESTTGDWVRAEDTAKLQAVVDALPKCQEPNCGKPATHGEGDLGCDDHVCCWPKLHPRDLELPYADALRALEKP